MGEYFILTLELYNYTGGVKRIKKDKMNTEFMFWDIKHVNVMWKWSINNYKKYYENTQKKILMKICFNFCKMVYAY